MIGLVSVPILVTGRAREVSYKADLSCTFDRAGWQLSNGEPRSHYHGELRHSGDIHPLISCIRIVQRGRTML
jgi:hypothetical protein